MIIIITLDAEKGVVGIGVESIAREQGGAEETKGTGRCGGAEV